MTALLALGCSPGGVSMNGGGNPLGPDAGLPASGRVTEGLAVLYNFDEGAGTTVYDTSGQVPALDLSITPAAAVTWVERGISVASPALMAAGPATRVSSACQAANAITVEAWVRAENIVQSGPARILDISSSQTPDESNVVFGQSGTLAETRLRTSETELNGTPSIESGINAFGSAINHIVYTRSGLADTATMWVNGSASETIDLAGSFVNWDMSYPLTVANESGGNRPWVGEIYLLAVYCRALGAAEVGRNFETGY